MTTDVLLTGFEPFDGAALNESWEAVRRATPILRGKGLAVEAIELPVEFGRAGDLLEEAVHALRPPLVIAVGLAAGRTAITPERVAINLRDARIPDGAGASPIDEPVIAGGPVGHFTSLPVKAIVAALREAGLPAAVSQTAGTYVCNDLAYRIAHLLATVPELAGVRGGFVHVPAADVLPVEETARGIVQLVMAARETAVDSVLPGGAEH